MGKVKTPGSTSEPKAMRPGLTIEADEGMTLTNGETFGKVVYLGINDSASNWQEITYEEVQTLQETLE